MREKVNRYFNSLKYYRALYIIISTYSLKTASQKQTNLLNLSYAKENTV